MVRLTQTVDYVFKISEHSFIDEAVNMNFGMIMEETNLEFKSKSNFLKIKSASMKEKSIFAKKFKFEDIGVGGLDKEIIQMFRRAFATRRLPASVLHKYGKTHVKGVLLYGPPGTGKTLIAKELAKCLNSVKPEVINGKYPTHLRSISVEQVRWRVRGKCKKTIRASSEGRTGAG